MACSGQDCEWLEYRAKAIVIVHEEFSGDCNNETKEKLREQIRSRLSSAVAKDTHVVKPCTEKDSKGKPCVCFADPDKEPDKGWQPAGSGTWEDSVKEGSCTLKARVEYKREAKHIPGHCWDPLPMGPGGGKATSAKGNKK